MRTLDLLPPSFLSVLVFFVTVVFGPKVMLIETPKFEPYFFNSMFEPLNLFEIQEGTSNKI